MKALHCFVITGISSHFSDGKTDSKVRCTDQKFSLRAMFLPDMCFVQAENVFAAELPIFFDA